MVTDDRQRDAISRAAIAITDADALLITAGAGMGVDSGLPDFRSAGGFWREYPRLGQLGISFEEMAQPRWFRDDPAMAWAFYGQRQALYRRTRPHPGFDALLRWGSTRPLGVFVYTSNVDGQFQRAGFDADRVLECHGSIHHLQCTGPCSQATWPAEPKDYDVDDSAFRVRGDLPSCPRCGGVARPNVLMFMDGDWISTRSDLAWSRHADWLAAVRGRRLAVVEVGAGVHLPAVRAYSERMVARMHARLVRINPTSAEGPRGTIALAMPAAQALAAIGENLPAR
jgi:NAD-dependent SIR2 family protein deacetylase